MASHGVRLGDDGRLEVVRAAPPEDPERLRRTVEAARAAAGAGAVDVVTVSDDGAAIEVVIAYAGRSPQAPMPGADLAAIAGPLAAAIGDLHLRGRVHGALVAEHVLVDAAGAVRLCGWGHEGGTTADDVVSFGRLLHALLDADDRSAAADAIRAAADRCCTEEPAARPTMAAVAASLASLGGPRRTITAATRGAARAPRRASDRTPRRRPGVAAVPAVPAVAAVIVVAAMALVVFTFGGARRGAPPAAGRAAASAPASTSTSTSTTSTSTSLGRAVRVWPPTPRQLEAGGATWTFGTTADVVVVGDWDCDGVGTPALVDANGAVWVVDTWPAGDEATARYVTTVAGALDATVDATSRCDALVVTTRDGDVRPSLSA